MGLSFFMQLGRCVGPMLLRPKCERCHRQPGRRIPCRICGLRVGPGCCYDREKDCCFGCSYLVPDPEPDPEPAGNRRNQPTSTAAPWADGEKERSDRAIVCGWTTLKYCTCTAIVVLTRTENGTSCQQSPGPQCKEVASRSWCPWRLRELRAAKHSSPGFITTFGSALDTLVA